MDKNEKSRSQFRWVTAWLMPIPAVALVVMVLALSLMHFMDKTLLQIVLVIVAVVVYVATSVILRRALPTLEKRMYPEEN